MLGQVCSALERNSQNRTERKWTDETREEQDGSRTVQIVSRAVTSQSRSRSMAEQTHVKEETQQSKRGQGRESQAREGQGRVMPKNMTELDLLTAG